MSDEGQFEWMALNPLHLAQMDDATLRDVGFSNQEIGLLAEVLDTARVLHLQVKD